MNPSPEPSVRGAATRPPPSITSQPLPEPLRQFVESCHWTFARTDAEIWPHGFIVRDRVDKSLFVALVRHIRAHGYPGRLYAKPITFFDEDGLFYWTMGAPVEETNVINRCRQKQTYEYWLERGTLPEPREQKPLQ